ncbi:MAG TPA: hypothetical protein VGC65_06770 [Bacteroidia bacterium]
MSKKEKQAVKSSPGIRKEVAKTPAKMDLLDRLNSWLEKHEKKVFYSLLFLSTLFSLLMFDSKVSDGGDDSSYIERAWSFIHEGKYPYFQGPGYPVALSFFVKLFGLNVVALKMFSVICQFGFVCVTYFTFRKRIPYLVLLALITFISFNNFILYYASQTFTETFFLFLQSICLYVTFRIIDSIKKDSGLLSGFQENYGKWLIFGLMFVLLAISKSIGFIAVGGVVMYFLFTKNYKQVAYAVIMFFAFRFLYQLITTSAFGENTSNQMEMMLRKDLYKPLAGHEDFGGMIDRFFNNFNTYISLHIYRIMNLRSFEYDMSRIIPALSYITALVFGIFTFLSYKKNKFVFFSSIYLAVLCGGIFIGVQALNMQDRLIIIVTPLVFMVLFFGFYELAKRVKGLQGIFIIFAAIMLVVTIGKTTVLAKQNVIALKKNLSGDIYYSYTPDWENFLKMSKYCADSLPAEAQVISRKPAMSFIYGNGKKFVGQYIVTTMNADTVLMNWKKLNVQYVMLASLRMNPKKNNGMVINTVHRMIGPVYDAYPEKIRLVKTIGTLEKCDLYEIKY